MQEQLLTLNDKMLLQMAPEATHQHKKGGLYRYIGPVRDAATGRILRINGEAQILYEHIYPHQRGCWVRSSSEFFDGRFRELHA